MFARIKQLRPGAVALVVGVVILGGSAVAAAAPAHHGRGGQGGQRAGSVVTSVNGSSAVNSCGSAGATGSFTVVGQRLRIVTIDVLSTTTFSDSADPSPSFADVCVGNHVRITGTNTSGTVSASSVTVLPPNTTHQTNGVVTSVNGASAVGSCGVATETGTFTFVGRRLRIVTVDVVSATTFADTAVTTPSFADVCVGSEVEILGTFASEVLTASSVTVQPPRPDSVSGLVTSVNGSSTSDSCGSSGVAGYFSVAPRRSTASVTIDVSATTTFTDAADPTPSFADVCVGDNVKALGALSGATLTATSVAVTPPNLGLDQGTVTSVNGVSTTGTCGTASSAGEFTLVGNWRQGIVTVDVATTTKFIDPGVTTPSFADVCVGVRGQALSGPI